MLRVIIVWLTSSSQRAAAASTVYEEMSATVLQEKALTVSSENWTPCRRRGEEVYLYQAESAG